LKVLIGILVEENYLENGTTEKISQLAEVGVL